MKTAESMHERERAGSWEGKERKKPVSFSSQLGGPRRRRCPPPSPPRWVGGHTGLLRVTGHLGAEPGHRRPFSTRRGCLSSGSQEAAGLTGLTDHPRVLLEERRGGGCLPMPARVLATRRPAGLPLPPPSTLCALSFFPATKRQSNDTRPFR